jgi:hypothetical protein
MDRMFVKITKHEQTKTLPNYSLRNVSLRAEETEKPLFNAKTPDDDGLALMAVMQHLGYEPMIKVDGVVMSYADYEEHVRKR